MLDEFDIQHIKQTRMDITRHRLEDIRLTKEVAGRPDPFTGDVTITEENFVVQGTWKTLISQSGGEGEIKYVGGVLVETDDAIIDLDIEIDITGVTKAERIRTGQKYVFKAHDILGLGEPNRHYILLELIK